MTSKEATARIKINKLLEAAGWRFFAEGKSPANIQLEPSITIKTQDLDALGEDFEKSSKGFIDFLLLNEKGFPFIVLEAKAESKSPLAGKEQARKYAQSQKCRFIILSNGNLHYFWDLERGNPYVITTFPTPSSVMGYQKSVPDPKRLVEETIGDDYVVLTQRPGYAVEAAWKHEAERDGFITANSLRFLRPYQKKAMSALQSAVKSGKDRFLFEMATGTGKTLTAAAVIKLFLRTGNAQRVLFLVDRLELEDQAWKAFNKVLANDYKTVIYKDNRDDWRHAEIVVTTVQSLLFNNKYQQLFSPTDFDLVISDEAHRSIGGKVPDPKSQVEQITIALIYKFMDDMDAEAEELGGKRKFFTGDFARYGWAKLMSKGIGGHELIGLYGEGISTMPQNPGIPVLFRDIFKNAYLPYRDPETLKSFLKIINEFTYDHSERLGDAFEYLLSVLGSQGDAGQFRTPRHIIDFIVEVLAPKKNEVILDPACGTAGFLISAWKHILRANTTPSPLAGEGGGEGAGVRAGDLLTPDEKGKLAQNFKGYDISPDMVRLSLVNLYLHGFTDPHIYEYDTLTSEERWNEYADVILANPPFMSPKGGIKPHKRFSIQAKRSEVLFVDYMAEHLPPTGRAGIIVPQGILTDKSAAFSKLRSKLINEYGLEAVITLPAGCFRPYADAETAILIFQKQRSSDFVWFYELTNDGFTQDDRRTSIPDNDIPEIVRLWPSRGDSPKSFSVTLSEIKERGEDLSLGEYKKDPLAIASKDIPRGWHVMRLDSIVEEVNIRAGENHQYPVLSVTKHKGFVRSSDYFKKRIFSDDTSSYKLVERGQFAYSTIHLDEGAIGYLEQCDAGIISPMYKVFRLKETKVDIQPAFLYHILKSAPLVEKYRNFGKGSIKRRKSVSFEKFGSISVPIPPPPIQRRLVAHIEGVQELETRLEAARIELASELERTLNLVGLAKG